MLGSSGNTQMVVLGWDVGGVRKYRYLSSGSRIVQVVSSAWDLGGVRGQSRRFPPSSGVVKDALRRARLKSGVPGGVISSGPMKCIWWISGLRLPMAAVLSKVSSTSSWSMAFKFSGQK